MPIEKPSIGPVIAIIVIVVLLILGAFYVWSTKEASKVAPPVETPTSSVAPRNDTAKVSDDQQIIDDLNFDDISSDVQNIK